MKKSVSRTAETVMGILGVIAGIIGAFMAGVIGGATEAITGDSGGLGGLGSAAFIFSILGIVSIIMINKKRKFSGWGFIISAIGILVSISMFGILPAIFFLISGIMMFTKKVPEQVEKSVESNNENIEITNKESNTVSTSKKKSKKILLIILGAVIGVIIIGSIVGGGSSTSVRQEFYYINDIVQVENLEYTVLDIYSAKSLENEYLNSTAQGTYYIVEVNVKNNDKESRTIDSSLFKLVEEDGTEYTADSSAADLIEGNSDFFLSSLNPKMQQRGYIVFDIPDINSSYSLKVSGGMWSSKNKLISLKYDPTKDIAEESSQNTEETNKDYVENKKNQTVNLSNEGNENGQANEYYIWDTVRVGNFEYIVNNIYQTGEVGNDFFKETAKGVYILLEVEVCNKDKEARVMDTNMFTLVDEEGYEYESNSSASIAANNTDGGFFYESLNPKLSKTGYVVFDVPTLEVAYDLKVNEGILNSSYERIHLAYNPETVTMQSTKADSYYEDNTQEDSEEDLEGTEELERGFPDYIVFENATASSTLKSSQYAYEPQFVLDWDNSTAWVEGKDDDGIGEWIKLENHEPVIVSGIEISNGYNKSEDIYYANNRIKTVQIEFSDGTKIQKALVDQYLYGNSLYLDNPVKTTYIKIKIIDIYKGSNYSDTCISGVHVYR